jgi:hypothetical protein
MEAQAGLARAAVDNGPGLGPRTISQRTKGYKGTRRLNALFVFLFLWPFILIGGYERATRITAPVLLLVLVAVLCCSNRPFLWRQFPVEAGGTDGTDGADGTDNGNPRLPRRISPPSSQYTDPKAAIDFYTSKFDCEKARFANLMDGVWAQKSWLLFSKVDQPPKADLTSAVWHFGWGAENMKEVYEKQLASGTKFFTSITDISGWQRHGTFFMCLGLALIELNTGHHHRTSPSLQCRSRGAGRVCKTSAPGAEHRRPHVSRSVSRYPDGLSTSLTMDNVNIICDPVEYTQFYRSNGTERLSSSRREDTWLTISPSA